MRTLSHQKRREDRLTVMVGMARCAIGIPRLRDGVPTIVRCALVSLLLWAARVYAQETPFTSATISGLGARNIGSAAMSGRISAIAGTREPSGKITLFVGAASGGVWKSDDSGTRYRPVFDEQRVQSIGALALDPKNSKNVWVGRSEEHTSELQSQSNLVCRLLLGK